jgi:Ser/Thr protein kinase RdoA (MazF antagonist)
MSSDLISLAKIEIKKYAIYGDFVKIAPYGKGHINQTFASVWNQAGKKVRYIHQRINSSIFKKPVQLMQNIVNVTNFIRNEFPTKDASQSVLTLVPTYSNQFYSIDKNGGYWRTYLFIEKMKSLEIARTQEDIYFLGKVIGDFQSKLSNYNGQSLYETIPDFHNMKIRYIDFYNSLKIDKLQRANTCKKEIDFFIDNEKKGYVLIDLLLDGKIPERITHNDTKMNNILISKNDPDIFCVIDLDTIMPGSALFDFGDLVRTGTNTAKEDEKDLSKVKFNIDNYNALKDGYLSAAKGFLTETELEFLPDAGRYLTQIVGLRFLTDYLKGDVYFNTTYTTHNLVRCNTQIALINDMDKKLFNNTHSTAPNV